MSEYSAMTVNERLFASGLMEEWDQAVSRKDRLKLIELLWRVELADQAATIVDLIIAKGCALEIPGERVST